MISTPTPARRGSTLAIVVLALGLAAAGAAALSGAMAARRHDLGQRQLMLQGREFALGGRSLGFGSTVAVNGWRIAVAADGTVTASHPAGSYTLGHDGDGRWIPRGRR